MGMSGDLKIAYNLIRVIVGDKADVKVMYFDLNHQIGAAIDMRDGSERFSIRVNRGDDFVTQIVMKLKDKGYE